MIFDLASEDKFDQFASRLLVAGVKKLARGGPKNFRRRRGGRASAIAGDLRVECSQLGGSLQFEWNERGRASALRFDGESSQIIRGLGELLGLNKILYPQDLPRAQIFQRALFLEAFGAGDSVLFVFQDALVNWPALRQRNPGSIRNVSQDFGRVGSGRSQIKQPRGGRSVIADGEVGAAKRSIRTIVSIAPEIGPKKRIGIRFQWREEAARVQMIANLRKVRSKGLRHPPSIDLPRKRGQREFPLRPSLRPGTPL